MVGFLVTWRARCRWMWRRCLSRELGSTVGRWRRSKDCWSTGWLGACCLCVLGQAAKSPLERLEPLQYVRLISALVLLTGGGIFVVLFAWMMLRAGRRKVRREDAARDRMGQRTYVDDWAAKPLVKSEDTGRDVDLE